jgi:hypothetical protein
MADLLQVRMTVYALSSASQQADSIHPDGIDRSRRGYAWRWYGWPEFTRPLCLAIGRLSRRKAGQPPWPHVESSSCQHYTGPGASGRLRSSDMHTNLTPLVLMPARHTLARCTAHYH